MLHIIVGPMFSGKSTELIKILQRSNIAKKSVVAFKPHLDNRYSNESKIVSHVGNAFQCITVERSKDIVGIVQQFSNPLVVIDELNRFDAAIFETVMELSFKYDVVAAGLNLDYKGDPFENVSKLLPYAEKITKLTAVCI